jgi:hypothetical protein
MKRITLPARALFMALLFWAVLPGYANNIAWTNTAGGNWSGVSNWNPNEVPGVSDTAIITNGGIYVVTLDVSPVIASLKLGGSSGQQTLAMAGYSLTITNASQVQSNGILQLAGGILGGTGPLAVNGQLEWTGGRIDANTVLTVATNGLVLVNGDGSYLDLSGELTNAGTIVLTNGGIRCLDYNGYGGGYGLLINAPGGLINLQGGALIDFYNDNSGIGAPAVTNYGTIRKSSGGDTTPINAPFYNYGTLDVQSGIVSVAGGGSGSGVFLAEAGATLDFPGDYEVDSALTGAGTNTFAYNGTFELNGQLNTSYALLAGNAILGGTNGVIASQLAWNASARIGAGSVLTVATNGLVLVNGGESFVDFSGELTNAGTIVLTNGGIRCLDYNGYGGGYGLLINAPGGLINLQGGALIDFYNDGSGIGTPVVTNYGTVRKTSGTDTAAINAPFYNFGTLDAQTGVISLEGPYGLTGGTLNVGISGPANFGVINLTGSPGLTGTISANLNSNYVPLLGSVFPVVTYTTYSGAFTSANLPALAVWQTAYNAADVTLTVLKWVPQLKWANPAGIVYGTVLSGAQLDATAASPTNLSGSLLGTLTYTPPTNSALFASNNQTLSVTFAPNDTANYISVTTNVTINVLKAPLTVTATNQSKTYGQTKTFAGTEFTTSGLKYSDSVASVSLVSPGAAATALVAGSPYTITNSAAAGSGLVNYTISYVNGLLTVNPAALTVTANTQSKTYGQTVVFGSGSTLFTPNGLQNGESIGTVTLAVSGNGGAGSAPVAGSPYTITPSAATGGTFTAGNYAITYATNALTVNAAALTVAANAQSKTYGQTVVFGSGSTLFTPSGLQNSESIGTVTLAVTGSGGAATASVAGSPYTITPSAATGGTFTAGNYAITYATNALTVNAAALTVTANAQSKTYGQTLLFGSGSTLFTPSGLQNSESIGTVTLAVSGNGGAAAASVANSPYTITPSAATGGTFTAGNYAITYDPGLLSVNKATVTITSGITANNKFYDHTTTATLSSNNVVFLGVLNGDTVNLNTNGYTASFAGFSPGSGIAVTVSGLSLSGAAAGNYALTQPAGLTANINAPSLQVQRSLPNMVLSWPAAASTSVLNGTPSLSSPIHWTPVTSGITVLGTNNTITLNATNGIQFYSLIAP